MKIINALLLIALLCWTIPSLARKSPGAAEQAETRNLMPVPASLSFQNGRLPLDTSFTIAVKGTSDARLAAAIERVTRRLEKRTSYDYSRAITDNADAAALVIQRQNEGQQIPALGEDESYTLNVSDKQATLNAPTTLGVLRGLETFLQLLEGDRHGYYLPCVRIEDKPRFPWRGLMIDACRHWIPVDTIKRNLDGMAAVKLNVFHWHLTEDQGWRVESKKYPKLQQNGSDGNYYTQAQITEIVAYAAARGIRVIPEFELPGHSTALLTAYPDYGSAPGPYQIERRWGIHQPTLDPTNEAVYKFIDGLIGEMATLFPDAYLHIGGDEVEGSQWKGNQKIQAFMQAKGLANLEALHAYFNQRLNAILKKHGKKMVGWDEIFHPDLPNDIVVQSWRGQASLATGAKKGYLGILSNGYYLDHVLPAAKHYLIDPISASSELSDAERARILGGEACLWSEYVSDETIDSRIWPRAAAIAERFWSPREVNHVDEMYRRLAAISVQLEEHGLRHEKQTDLFLRRLAQTSDIGPLKTLAEIVEPIKFLDRYKERQYTQQTPLTRFVDAARPDSAKGREFARLVDELIADAPAFRNHRDRVLAILSRWRVAGTEIPELINHAPALKEIEPLTADLINLSGAGEEALNSLSNGVVPAESWRTASLALVDSAARPKAEVEIVVAPAIRKLIIAAAEIGQLKTMAPADWKKRVMELAAEKKGARK